MTKTNKLIVGAVVVLGAYYLYTKNKAKIDVADLKEGADYPAPPTTISKPPLPTTTTQVNLSSATISEGVLDKFKFSNFAGSRNSF